jgi:predicted acyltransferase
MSLAATPTRIQSLDQFRGYSVAGLFVVNFLGGLAVTHQVLRHNNTHFSYADSIMPSFIFACGYSYRMSFLKRLEDIGPAAARWRFLSRSFGLILLSLMVFGFNEEFKSWSEMSLASGLQFVVELLKANMWEVLAIIGACQILIMPLVAKSMSVRIGGFVGLGVLHLLLSWWFNYDFVYGRPNWLDELLGTSGKRAWDGGFFGLLAWSEMMLAGTLAYDIIQRHASRGAAVRLGAWGGLLMLAGYGLSGLTRLYDLPGVDALPPIAAISDDSAAATTEPVKSELGDSPVLPDWSQAQGRSWSELLAEPPFLPPPTVERRALNYWMMDKRLPTPTFVLFSTGFAMALYGLFVWGCDMCGWTLGLFRTFGQNPLAAYIIHHFVENAILAVVPKDSPLAWATLGLCVSFGITYMFVRFLEKRGLYLRL